MDPAKKTFDFSQYQKDYRKAHPDKQLKWRLNSYANTLRRNGYIVITPAEQAEMQEA